MEDNKDNSLQRKIAYVLDTNVLIHNPDSVLNFEEHRVIIPMTVLEELDKLKSGKASVSAECRAAIRLIDAILGNAAPEQIRQGVPIWRDITRTHLGTLSVLMDTQDGPGKDYLSNELNDNKIINQLVTLQAADISTKIVLVTKDINMRLKARACGLSAEDYHNDQLVSDIKQLARGYHEVSGSFWDRVSKVETRQGHGRTWHMVPRSSELLSHRYRHGIGLTLIAGGLFAAIAPRCSSVSKKSRKLIRSAPVPGTGADLAEPELPAAVVEPERSFFFLPDQEPEPVDERDLHETMKLWRHGRATRTIGQALQDGYVTIFTVVMLGAMIVSVVLRAQALGLGLMWVPAVLVLMNVVFALGAYPLGKLSDRIRHTTLLAWASPVPRMVRSKVVPLRADRGSMAVMEAEGTSAGSTVMITVSGRLLRPALSSTTSSRTWVPTGRFTSILGSSVERGKSERVYAMVCSLLILFL